MPYSIANPSQESLAPLNNPVVVVNRTIKRHTVIKKHTHEWGQFIYANQGVLAVVTDDCRYVVPSQQGVWVPPEKGHEVSTLSDVELTSFYIDLACLERLPPTCEVLNVTSFLKTLIIEAKHIPKIFSWSDSSGRLLRLILDRIASAESVDLQLPFPRDKRLRLILDNMLTKTSEHKSIEQWGHEVGASGRTLSRLFKKETGMTFSDWKQRLNTQLAIRQLHEGMLINQISLDLGYGSTSAFISMFKKTTGLTPGNYQK